MAARSLLLPLAGWMVWVAGCENDSLGLNFDGGTDGGVGASGDGAPGGALEGGFPATGDTTAGVTFEQACADSIAFCERMDACAPYLLKLVWGDVPTCAARLRLSCLDGTSAPGVTAKPSAYLECSKQVRASSCEALLNNMVSCDLKGSLANGVACGSGAQCISGYCRKNSASCGVCGNRSEAGDPCRESEDCAAGFICKTNVCFKPAELGASCGDQQPCRSFLFCKAGACVGAGVGGDPCSGGDSCQVQNGFFCNSVARVCQKFTVARGGDACGFLQNPVTLCGESSDCSPNAASGVCQAPAHDGEPCGPGNGNRKCLAPATCTDGLCKLPSAAACR